MEVRFQSLSGCSASLQSTETTTIEELRRSIAEWLQSNPADLVLIFQGSILRDSDFVSSFDFSPSDFVTVFDCSSVDELPPLPPPMPVFHSQDYSDRRWRPSQDSAVEIIMHVRPEIPEFRARLALELSNGDIHEALERLEVFEPRLPPPPPPPRPPRPPPPPPPPPPFGSEEGSDARLFLRRMRGTAVDSLSDDEKSQVWQLIQANPRLDEGLIVRIFMDSGKDSERAREIISYQ
jgi:hypothetical protein